MSTGPDLDTLPTGALLALLVEQNRQAILAVERVLPRIEEAVDGIVRCLERGGHLHYVGAGSSGRLALLDAAECPPTFGVAPDLVRAHLAGGEAAAGEALEGAEDDDAAGGRALRAAGVGERDVAVGIAASGSTPFVLGAMREAGRLGSLTVGIACAAATPLEAMVRVPVVLEVGAELLRGSTRLKAGTAQKIVLNMLSTAALSRLGFVYGDLMVGVLPRNAKLRARAVGIVCALCGVESAAASAALAPCDYEVRTAVICLRRSVDVPSARALLLSARGNLRQALLS